MAFCFQFWSCEKKTLKIKKFRETVKDEKIGDSFFFLQKYELTIIYDKNFFKIPGPYQL